MSVLPVFFTALAEEDLHQIVKLVLRITEGGGNDACAHKPNQPPTFAGRNYVELHATNRPVFQNDASRFMRTST